MTIPHNKATRGEAEKKKKMEGGLAVLHPTHQTIAYTPLIKKQGMVEKDRNNKKENSDELEQQAAKTMAENT